MTRLYVLDFDRTLGNFDVLYAEFLRLLEAYKLFDVKQLQIASHVAQARGESFSALEYIRPKVDSARLETLLNEFMGTQKSEYLNPGANELLEFIHETGQTALIVTYGESTWQRVKLVASGLSSRLPYIITDQPDKSILVESWRSANGKFMAPFHEKNQYDQAVIVDDKAKAFTHIEKNMHGYWVVTNKLLPSQSGKVPATVKKVSSLWEVVEAEQKIAS